MRKMMSLLAGGLFCLLQDGSGQSLAGYVTWNPAQSSFPVVDGQAWPGQVAGYFDRLPAAAAATVRPAVWTLSTNSAGLQLRFISDAPEIIVKYIVKDTFQLPNMPATGVSGLDLYTKTIDGSWLWCGGRLKFGDTIQYHVDGLDSTDQHVRNREYLLCLPLYNTVKWLQVYVPGHHQIEPIPARKDLPIVVYGTSIAQGGCASRPGLAWTSILGRRMDRPVINLGFSGNGLLENEVLDQVETIDAKIYVLDCLPNLVSLIHSPGEVKKRIAISVMRLHNKHPGVPILLVDHAGYSNESINRSSQDEIKSINELSTLVFDSLVTAGVKNIFRLSKEEIGLSMESTVDGVHPGDAGMMQYAAAYEKKLKEILQEPSGTLSTTIPVTQRRDAAMYDWETRHYEEMSYNLAHAPETIFLGNSITHYWSGAPVARRAGGPVSWKKYFGSMSVVNMGFGWDRVENVLWRIYHGELDHVHAKNMVLMIGTNNLLINSDQEIIQGLQFLVTAIQQKQPSMHILLMGIFPRREQEARVAAFNRQLSSTSFNVNVRYADAGKLFLRPDNTLNESLFSDGLHPSEAGYEKLGAFIHDRLNW